MRVFFSPNGGAAQAIADEIALAHTSIRVLAYTFTIPVIWQALLAAHGRGVDVQVIFDMSAAKDTDCCINQLKDFFPCYADGAHAIAHNKTCVIDNTTVITGSMNYTTNGDQHNGENTLFIEDLMLAGLYSQNWLLHQSHSVRVT